VKIRIQTFHNGDDTVIVWQPDQKLADCRGFALFRYILGKNNSETEEIVSSWVGWEDEEWKPGERKPSSEWPIQRFIWTDYIAKPGQTLRYRVVPMCGGKDDLAPRKDWASPKTDPVTVTSNHTPHFEAYFNRGIVATQWLTRRLGGIRPTEQRKKLATLIKDPASEIRQFLAGKCARPCYGF
jgi:hypothetical protein